MKPTVLLAIPMAGALMAQEPQAPTENSCVTCHRRPETVRELPAGQQDQFLHWYGSVHGSHDVTCDQCHGGDPTATDQAGAHKGVAPTADPTSKVYYKNLPETCGACHQDVYRHFSQSRHFISLKADRLAPSCTTCHGFEMEIASVNPDRIVQRCSICHNERQDIHPEVTTSVRKLLENIARTQAGIRRAEATLDLVTAEGLEAAKAREHLEKARERMHGTRIFWHQFELPAFAEELEKVAKDAEIAYLEARRVLLSR